MDKKPCKNQASDSEVKACITCKCDKPIDAFGNHCVKYKRNVCKQCFLFNQKNRQRELSEWFQNLKREKICENCGNCDHRVLEFHHKNDKKFNIADGVCKCYSKKVILNEIKKCKVFCANCHRIHHHEEKLMEA